LLRLKRGSILPGSLSPNVSGDAAVFGSNSKIQARLYEPQQPGSQGTRSGKLVRWHFMRTCCGS